MNSELGVRTLASLINDVVRLLFIFVRSSSTTDLRFPIRKAIRILKIKVVYILPNVSVSIG